MKTTPKTHKSSGAVVAKPKAVPFSIKFSRLGFRYGGALFPKLAADLAMKRFMTPRRLKGKDLPNIFEEAFILSIPYQGGKVRTYMWGYTGKIVLLVHGWESGPHFFEAIIAALIDAGYRVLAIEGPAHGDSLQKQTNMIDFGHALQAVMERMEKSGGIAAVLGHSFGGSTLVNTFTRFSPPRALEKMVLIAIPARIDLVFERYFAFLRLPSRVRDKFKASLFRLFGLKVEEMQLKYWCAQVNNAQVLLIHDRHDKLIPFEESEALVADWPVANLWETENLGHHRIIKHETVIDKILQFLD